MIKNDAKILVARSSMPEFSEYIEEIKSLWDSHWLTNMGEKHNLFSEMLKSYLNVSNIELFTNGHMALELSIQALNLQGEIITTPYTFASTTHAIVRNNCTPVFCDINKEDFTIDVNKIESLITDKTVAILPVHVYGNICDVSNIEKIAKKYNLKVIYDAAHAFGEKYNGDYIGNFGDVSCFSFHATKVFNTIEGGAAVFHDEEIGKRLYQLKNFGIAGEETVDGVGSNAKMNEFCAAMGICNLRHINSDIASREKLVNRYIDNLSELDGISVNNFQNSVSYNYSYFPIIVNKEVFGCNRDFVYNELKNHNIYSRKYFYPITNSFDCYKNLFEPDSTPNALEISKNVLTLPLWVGMSNMVVDDICGIIASCKQ